MDLEPRNDALRKHPNFRNGANADIAITPRGSAFYFAICGVMALSGFIFLGLGLRKHRRDRLFHYITAAIVFVAAIAYFTMGANLGFTPIRPEFLRSDPKVRGAFREIFYVRYIDWVITTPLLLMDLLLTAGMSWPTILWVMLVDEIMIVCGLVGALLETRYKWAYFTFGCVALFYIIYVLAWEARLHARALGADVSRVFFQCTALTALLWLLYPIAWGLSEGGNVIAPDSEAVFYGVLDFLAKPVFGALLLWGHKNISPSRLGLAIRDYEDEPTVHGPTRSHEKRAPVSGATNGDHLAMHGTDTTAVP